MKKRQSCAVHGKDMQAALLKDSHYSLKITKVPNNKCLIKFETICHNHYIMKKREPCAVHEKYMQGALLKNSHLRFYRAQVLGNELLIKSEMPFKSLTSFHNVIAAMTFLNQSLETTEKIQANCKLPNPELSVSPR